MGRLIIDRDETVIVGPADWGAGSQFLWRYWVSEGREERLDWPGRDFFLSPAADGIHLMMKERLEDGTQRFTVRPIAEIDRVLATAENGRQGWSFHGPTELWNLVPRYALVWSEELERTALLHLDPEDPEPDPLSWHSEEAYDTTYQGLLEVYGVPESELVIIAVQRDSHPVLYHPRERRVVRKLHLVSDRPGNPSLHFRRHADELWAVDYDTLVRLRPGSWEVFDSLRLQEEQGVRKFIGSVWFPPSEEACVVARPFSGDVVLVDPTTFRVVKRIILGEQPLDAVLLRDGTVIARDWQTRRLLRASEQ